MTFSVIFYQFESALGVLAFTVYSVGMSVVMYVFLCNLCDWEAVFAERVGS